MDIEVSVVNQKLRIATNLNNLVSGSNEFIRFVFDLTDDWYGLSPFAQFHQGGIAYNRSLDENNSVYLPNEIGAGTCKLTLYGSSNGRTGTTNYVTLYIDENIFVYDAIAGDGVPSAVNDRFLQIEESILDLADSISGKYTLPATGIPYNDLSSAVQQMISNSGGSGSGEPIIVQGDTSTTYGFATQAALTTFRNGYPNAFKQGDYVWVKDGDYASHTYTLYVVDQNKQLSEVFKIGDTLVVTVSSGNNNQLSVNKTIAQINTELNNGKNIALRTEYGVVLNPTYYTANGIYFTTVADFDGEFYARTYSITGNGLSVSTKSLSEGTGFKVVKAIGNDETGYEVDIEHSDIIYPSQVNAILHNDYSEDIRMEIGGWTLSCVSAGVDNAQFSGLVFGSDSCILAFAYWDGYNNTVTLIKIRTEDLALKSDIVPISGSNSDVTEATVASWGFTKNAGTYSKPVGGIPKTDLDTSVQTSLELADTSVQPSVLTEIADAIFECQKLIVTYNALSHTVDVTPSQMYSYWHPQNSSGNYIVLRETEYGDYEIPLVFVDSTSTHAVFSGIIHNNISGDTESVVYYVSSDRSTTKIVRPVFASSSDMAYAVADWLDENITNPTDPVIDTSLLVQGAAADAKVVGDALALKADEADIVYEHREEPSDEPETYTRGGSFASSGSAMSVVGIVVPNELDEYDVSEIRVKAASGTTVKLALYTPVLFQSPNRYSFDVEAYIAEAVSESGVATFTFTTPYHYDAAHHLLVALTAENKLGYTKTTQAEGSAQSETCPNLLTQSVNWTGIPAGENTHDYIGTALGGLAYIGITADSGNQNTGCYEVDWMSAASAPVITYETVKERIAAIEDEIADVQDDVEDLRQAIEDFDPGSAVTIEDNDTAGGVDLTVGENSVNLAKQSDIVYRTVTPPPGAELTTYLRGGVNTPLGSNQSAYVVAVPNGLTSYYIHEIRVRASSSATVKLALYKLVEFQAAQHRYSGDVEAYLGTGTPVDGVVTFTFETPLLFDPTQYVIMALSANTGLGYVRTTTEEGAAQSALCPNFCNYSVDWTNVPVGENTHDYIGGNLGGVFQLSVSADSGNQITGAYAVDWTAEETAPIVTYETIKQRIAAIEDEIADIAVPSGDGYNPLYGKKWAAVGDSVTHGVDEVYVDGVAQTYDRLISQRNGMTLYKDGINGSTMTRVTGKELISFCNTRYLDVPHDCDYITIWFGINDNTAQVTVGTIDSADDTTFYGAYNKVLTHLINNSPTTCKIGLVVSHMCGSLAEPIRNIAKKYGLKVFDIPADPNIPYWCPQSSYYASTIASSVATLRQSQWWVNPSHPSIDGYKYISYPFEDWLRSL